MRLSKSGQSRTFACCSNCASRGHWAAHPCGPKFNLPADSANVGMFRRHYRALKNRQAAKGRFAIVPEAESGDLMQMDFSGSFSRGLSTPQSRTVAEAGS